MEQDAGNKDESGSEPDERPVTNLQNLSGAEEDIGSDPGSSSSASEEEQDPGAKASLWCPNSFVTVPVLSTSPESSMLLVGRTAWPVAAAAARQPRSKPPALEGAQQTYQQVENRWKQAVEAGEQEPAGGAVLQETCAAPA